eukprot:ctg_334.g185
MSTICARRHHRAGEITGRGPGRCAHREKGSSKTVPGGRWRTGLHWDPGLSPGAAPETSSGSRPESFLPAQTCLSRRALDDVRVAHGNDSASSRFGDESGWDRPPPQRRCFNCLCEHATAFSPLRVAARSGDALAMSMRAKHSNAIVLTLPSRQDDDFRFSLVTFNVLAPCYRQGERGAPSGSTARYRIRMPHPEARRQERGRLGHVDSPGALSNAALARGATATARRSGGAAGAPGVGLPTRTHVSGGQRSLDVSAYGHGATPAGGAGAHPAARRRRLHLRRWRRAGVPLRRLEHPASGRCRRAVSAAGRLPCRPHRTHHAHPPHPPRRSGGMRHDLLPGTELHSAHPGAAAAVASESIHLASRTGVCTVGSSAVTGSVCDRSTESALVIGARESVASSTDTPRNTPGTTGGFPAAPAATPTDTSDDTAGHRARNRKPCPARRRPPFGTSNRCHIRHLQYCCHAAGPPQSAPAETSTPEWPPNSGAVYVRRHPTDAGRRSVVPAAPPCRAHRPATDTPARCAGCAGRPRYTASSDGRGRCGVCRWHTWVAPVPARSYAGLHRRAPGIAVGTHRALRAPAPPPASAICRVVARCCGRARAGAREQAARRGWRARACASHAG